MLEPPCLHCNRVLTYLQPAAAAGRWGVKLFTLFPVISDAAHFVEIDNSGDFFVSLLAANRGHAWQVLLMTWVKAL